VKVHSDSVRPGLALQGLERSGRPGGKAACDGPAGGLAAPVLTAHIDKSEALRVRFHNNLPKDPRPFGIPRTTVHYHGATTSSAGWLSELRFPARGTFEYSTPCSPGFSRCSR